jgi:enoyl-CoA hydratase/carnithine racemase
VNVTQVADHVRRITVSDPGALDRRDVTVGEQLRDTILQTADDDDVKVIVLGGLAGPSTGLVEPEHADPAARILYSGTRGLHQLITYCKKVVVAEVDGPCGATASALCLAADFVVATPAATFASPFAVPEANFPLAVLTMRSNRTRTWMFRGQPLAASEAYEAGFVNDIVAATDLERATTDLGRRVAVMPLDGITISKMNIGSAFDVIGVGRDFDAVEAAVAGTGGGW